MSATEAILDFTAAAHALPANVRLGSEAAALVLPDEGGVVPAIARTMLSLSSVLSGFN